MFLRFLTNLLTVGATVSAMLSAVAMASDLDCALPNSEREMLSDARDGQLDNLSLLTASLIASGVNDEAQLARQQESYDRHVQNVRALATETESVENPGELVLIYLHERILNREYQATCTELNRALEDGDYNCVSATVLYQCLCREVGLLPTAVATPTHVRCRFHQERTFDVETTCTDWFDVVRRDPSVQLFRTVHQTTRELTDVQLVAKIYYNRGISLLEARQYAQAVTLLRRSRGLDPEDEAATQNLAAAFNNWVLAECDAGRVSQAAALAEEGLREVPGYEPLLANDLHCHQQWALALCRENRFVEAIDALETARRRRPDVPLFDAGRFAVYRQWAESLFQSGRQEEGWQLFAQTRSLHFDHAEIARYEAVALHHSIDALIRNGDWKGAQVLLDRALLQLPADPVLHRQQARLTAQGS